MAPITASAAAPSPSSHPQANTFGNWRDVDNVEAYIVEAWGEGFMFGALLIMSCITIANMRKGVLLHKFILVELLLAMSHGTFCFMSFPGYGWYLSSTASLLYCSYFVHNVVAWMKIRPFFRGSHPSFPPSTCKWISRIYLSTLAMSAPVLIFEVYNNFRFFNNISHLYQRARPYEPLMRDPWWIFSCLVFFHVIRKCYSLNAFKLVRISPRFGILLLAIFLAMTFTVIDIISSIVPGLSVTDGINPYWKLALVFKCLTDNIMLDDFKSVLQRLGGMKLDGSTVMQTNSLNMEPSRLEKMGDDNGHTQNTTTSSKSNSHRHLSLSGRLLHESEELDDTGRTRRRQSMAASAVGSAGVKIRKLGHLPFLRDSARKEARRNMERNKKRSSAQQVRDELPLPPLAEADRAPGEAKSASEEPWEQVDFITALVDPEVEDEARRHRRP